MKKIIFLFISLIGFSLHIYSQEAAVLVEDNFSDNRYKWWTGKTQNGSGDILRGEYIIKYAGQKSWASTIHTGLNPRYDFVIESRISRISGTASNGYGLVFGKGQRGYYNFIITPAGRFYVRRVERGKKGQYLIRWKKTSAISQTSITNKLRVQKTGNEVLFYINERYVGKIPYQSFFGDQVGFMMYQRQQIAVDYLVVYGNGTQTVPQKEEKIIAAVQPKLEIRQIAINDKEDIGNMSSAYGNGNSIIEPGESVEVTAFVQNFGLATAKNVVAKIELGTDDRNISFPDEYKTFKLGDIPSGDYKKLSFFFFTSRRYASKDLPFKVKLTAGSYKTEQALGLKMNERTKNIVDVNISKLNLKETAEMKEITEIVVKADVDENIPITNFNGENTLAVIIGIENYKYAPLVDNAKRDAQVFYKYAVNVFGIPEDNIYFLTNREATLGEFNKIFSKDGWLARRSEQGKTNIIVYYAGHGAPDTKTKSAYMIPYDIDPNYAKTGFSLNRLYSSLAGLQAKSVTVFIDACFSGISRSNKMLIAGARGVIIKAESSAFSAKNMVVLAAASNDEYSVSYPEKYHGLFTYFLLKELKEKAYDLPTLPVRTFFEDIKKQVVKRAGYLDKQQTPTLQGNDKDRPVILQ
ncbi:MAG: caspase family protein [Bacteroidales bacterium]|nr:caspase family protein [Bacteroidales bacterium]